jgi:ketosteroid isomerase-like protein
MSQENIEIARRILLDDTPALYRLIAQTSPDFVWDMSTFEGWPDQGEFHGLEEFIAFLRRWVEPYAEWQIEVQDVIDTERDDVLALLHQRGRLRDSESWVEMQYGIVYTIQGGQLQRARCYATPEQAFKAAGLEK